MPSLIRATSFRAAVLVLTTALACVAGSSVQARAEAPASVNLRVTARPSVKAPTVAVEGTRFAVTVAIPSPRQATTVQLQFHDKHDYDFESTLSWTKRAAARVQGRAQVVFHVRADEAREAWFRAVVAYRGTSRVGTSAGVRVNYQHWFPISAFSRYYSAGLATESSAFQMAGRAWQGWYVYGVAGESRYTLGSACVRLRATVGVTDSSSDGATAAVTLATIAPGGASTVVYTSPDLVAGQTRTVDLALAKPYRISVAGQDTTPPVTDGSPQPRAYAAVGDPEFLCHVD